MVRTDGERAAVTVNLFQSLAEFADILPAWVHWSGPERGYPLSYAHFIHGLRYIQRKSAREKLRIADSIAVTRAADPNVFPNWIRNQEILGGLD